MFFCASLAKDQIVRRLLKYIAADFTEEEETHFVDQRIRSLEKQKKKVKTPAKKSSTKSIKAVEAESPSEEPKIERAEILDRIHYKYPHFSVEILISSIGKSYILAKIFDSKADKVAVLYPPKRNHFAKEYNQHQQSKMNHLDYMFLLMTQDTKPQITTVPTPYAKNFVKLFKEVANSAKFTKVLFCLFYCKVNLIGCRN